MGTIVAAGRKELFIEVCTHRFVLAAYKVQDLSPGNFSCDSYGG